MGRTTQGGATFRPLNHAFGIVAATGSATAFQTDPAQLRVESAVVRPRVTVTTGTRGQRAGNPDVFRARTPPPPVLCQRDRFEVRRITAVPHEAEMVDLVPDRDVLPVVGGAPCDLMDVSRAGRVSS